MRRKTSEVFIAAARNVHGDKYDYSLVDYSDAKKNVTIICAEHGPFQMMPSNHLKGQGCPRCVFTRTTEDFIRNAQKIWGDRYDYSKSEYVSARAKLIVICQEHGDFLISPNSHLQGHGCAKCSKNKKYTTKDFIEAARRRHGDYYDYSESEYVNSTSLIKIICPKHGPFQQRAGNHLRGIGCPKCGDESGGKHRLSNTEEFIRKATTIHGDKYDFSRVNYTLATEKVPIICKEHGEFWATPQSILAGHGCPVCAGNLQLDTAEFIRRANEVHDNFYDYSKSVYTRNQDKVCIICHQKYKNGKEHGEFWQNAGSHLHGCGCPRCNASHLEKQVRTLLGLHNFSFVEQQTFDWLIDISHMYLDFFLPDYGVAIECQGNQHFIPQDIWGGEDNLRLIQRRDHLKKQLCNEHGIEVIYYSNLHISYPYYVIEDQGQLIETIKANGKVDPSKWLDPVLPLEY